MTDIEYRTLMHKRDRATEKALSYLKAGEIELFKFYSSAARAFEARALDTSSKEREERLVKQISAQ